MSNQWRRPAATTAASAASGVASEVQGKNDKKKKRHPSCDIL